MSGWSSAAQAEYEREREFDEWLAEEAEERSRASRRDVNQTLYLVWCSSTEYVKVGIAEDLERRLRALQTGCPFELRVLARVMFVGMRAIEAERYVHEVWRSLRRRGEWFELSADLAPGYFRAAVERYVEQSDALRFCGPEGVAA